MSPPAEALQRIARLAPLGEVLAWLDGLAPVAPKAREPAAAVGATLAEDVAASGAQPAHAIAMRDGWAVAAESVSDAGPYTPVLLSSAPVWVETGAPMPANTDAVLPIDAVSMTKSGAEAIAPATAGDGALPAGGNAAAGSVLRRAGERVRAGDAAILRAAGVPRVVLRAPRIQIVCATVPTRSVADSLSPLLARAIEAEGGVAQLAQSAALESALLSPACDAIVTVGGTGTGRRDAAVKTLARVGTVAFHGLGIAPGETAALGLANGRPVLMVPGRLDAALAAWLVVGRRMIARLSGRAGEEAGTPATLARKVASTVGLAEVILVRRAADGVLPVASGVLPWSALARADGWILVPPESEGLAAGSSAEMRPLP